MEMGHNQENNNKNKDCQLSLSLHCNIGVRQIDICNFHCGSDFASFVVVMSPLILVNLLGQNAPTSMITETIRCL